MCIRDRFGAALLAAPLVFHVDHARPGVCGAELRLPAAGSTERWIFGAALLAAPLALDIDQTSSGVCGANLRLSAIGSAERWSSGAALLAGTLVTLLTTHIGHICPC